MRGLGAFEDAKTPPAILKIYSKLDTAGKRDALTTLASRVIFAKALMAAVTRGTVKANELPADIVRQLRAHGVKEINGNARQGLGREPIHAGGEAEGDCEI